MASAGRRRRRHSPEFVRPDMSDLRIVLIGKNGSENRRVANTILGTAAFHSEALSPYSQQSSLRISVKLEKRYVTVINTHLLQQNLSNPQTVQGVRECVSLSAPGPHVFVLVLQYKDFSENDKHRVKCVLNHFSYQAMKHTIVLTTDEEPRTSKLASVIWNNVIHDLIKECGGGNLHFDTTNPGWRSELFRRTEEILKKERKEFLICNMCEDEEKKDYGLTESFGSYGRDPGGVKLNLVVCGSNRELKSFISNLILKQSESRSELSSECVRRDVELDGRLISLVELPALFNTQLSEEEVMRQTHRCVSLCHPGVHVFILIIPDAPLNNEDRAEIEEIQRIFSSRVNKHIMILIKQDSDHQTAELNEETQSVIERFGGRHHFISLNTQVSVLMKKLEQMIEENRGEFFSTETLMEAQMKKLKEFEEIKKRVNSLETWFRSQDSREREDEVRIVLLGKTGVGKSSTGNTIFGRKVFISDISEESVTKVCQRETSEINSRHITVIDTPGLFGTELSNEEIQREISNSIPMILPGPHVFLLLIPLGRFTEEEAKSVKIIQETFGENSLKYTIVLFTNGDKLKNKTIDQFLGKPGSALKQLIETCGNGYHVFNNETRDRTQVTELLQKIDNMVKENGGSYYSCKMFREMEREIQEQQKKILMEKVEQVNREKEELMMKYVEEIKRMKMKMEEERKNHEKERKRREEEFIEREERYEREEQERKIREELKREREEWEKQKQQERQRREEEEEKWRKKEQAMWDEYNKKLKQERERMKKMMEEERQNHDKEKKIKEVEFKENEEQYKIEIQREREEWEKQKQEARQKRDEEERRRKIEQETWDEYYEKLQRERERRLREREDLQFKHEEEEERMKKMMEEERQIHEKERKRKEEEFREREEQYKREIKDIEERDRKIREELKREREEWEKQKQQERQKRDEEEERRTKKEQEMWDEYNQRLKQERERMKMMLEEEKQNRDQERKRREEEYMEREGRFKTEMKREREEWERQKQQERQRREEEEERRRKIEKETWDEYYEKLKRERERRQREREELQFKHEEEKAQVKKK